MILSSLRARLLAWLLWPLAGFVAIAGAISWQNAKATADIVQDNELLASVRIIGEDIDWDNGTLIVSIPPAALELFESPERDHVFYKIEDSRHRLLAGTPDLVLPDNVEESPIFYNQAQGTDQGLRVVAYTREMFNAGKVETVTVAVAKTERSRDAMVRRLLHPQFVRLIGMIFLAMLLVYAGLSRELRPLIKLKDTVADREASELEPIRVRRLHSEIRPIVEAINRCISRMSLQASTQRQFISDAAHQLRTPLTLLDTQIQFALSRRTPDVLLEETLISMQRSSIRMAKLTNKLLLLAHAESTSSYDVQDPVDLSATIATVLEDLISLAQIKQIDLGANIDEDLLVAGDRELTIAMLTNLVDNALKYTPAGGRVTVHAVREGSVALLHIADTGPGISPESRARVFERFYRASGDPDGSGLGLAIVKEIALRQGGAVTIAPGDGGVGLTVTVEMRLWNPVYVEVVAS